MKRIVCLILCILSFFSTQTIFASEEKHFNFDASKCVNLRIQYSQGQGFPSPVGERPDYNYTTTDPDEIKLLTEAVNNLRCTPCSLSGSSDGTYLDIYINGKRGIFFDVSLKICRVDDKYYQFNTDDYVALIKLIYDIKTKSDIKVSFEDEILRPYEKPILVEGRTLVPVSTIGKAIGAEIAWDGKEKTVELKKGEEKIVFAIGEDYIIKNGTAEKIDVGCRMSGYTAMVPVRAVAEFFGYTVAWENNTVCIRSE